MSAPRGRKQALRILIYACAALTVVLAGVVFLPSSAMKLQARLASSRPPRCKEALERLRQVAAAQAAFRAAQPAGAERYGDRSDLLAGGFLPGAPEPGDDGLARPAGFRITVAPSPIHPSYFWWAAAEDVTSGRCFYLNQSGVIYAADEPVRPISDANTEPDRGVPIGVR